MSRVIETYASRLTAPSPLWSGAPASSGGSLLAVTATGGPRVFSSSFNNVGIVDINGTTYFFPVLDNSEVVPMSFSGYFGGSADYSRQLTHGASGDVLVYQTDTAPGTQAIQMEMVNLSPATGTVYYEVSIPQYDINTSMTYGFGLATGFPPTGVFAFFVDASGGTVIDAISSTPLTTSTATGTVYGLWYNHADNTAGMIDGLGNSNSLTVSADIRGIHLYNLLGVTHGDTVGQTATLLIRTQQTTYTLKGLPVFSNVPSGAVDFRGDLIVP